MTLLAAVLLPLVAVALIVASAAWLEARRARREARQRPTPATPAPDAEARRDAERSVAALRRELGQRLDRVESTLAELEEASRRLVATLGDHGEHLERLEAQHAASEAAAEAREDPDDAAPVETDAEPSPAARVREHLEEQGYRRVTVVSDATEGEAAFRVEAERDGVTEKGRARVTDDGRIQVRLAPVLRVFP